MRKISSLLILIFLYVFSIQAQQTQVKKLKIEGHEAFLKVPEKPLKGNPWLWRAYFPHWHNHIDSILLEKGYHIAYINAADQFGSPKAMATWDHFYARMVNDFGLSQKVAFYGVSRGGMYVLNWAKHHPTVVSCIYLEAPVCNALSWPKKASEHDWELLKKEYNFSSDQEAEAYPDQPFDHVEGLAALKVPLLIAIANSDKIVPPAENSFILAKRYIQLGGSVTFLPMDRLLNVEKMKGHHFDIDNPQYIADYIDYHSQHASPLLASKKFHHYNGTKHLQSTIKFEKEKKGNIVFLGGSITYNPGWRQELESYFTSHFPTTEFNFFKAGIPSLGSLPHAFRFQTDVLDQVIPDVLFFEAAVNDRGNGYSAIDQKRSIEGIIRRAKQLNPKVDIIMMHFADPQKLENYSNGITPQEIINHNEVAAYYNVPVIDISREVYERIAHGEFEWKRDIKDLHPSPYGQQVYAHSMQTMLDTLIYGRDSNPLSVSSKLKKPLDKHCYMSARYEKVDQTKGDFVYHEIYEAMHQPTREGFTKVPMLIGEEVGQKLDYTFKGSAIGLCIISGNDAGIIEYSIDGGDYKKVDLFTRWSKSLHLPWYIMLEPNLKKKKHTLHLRIAQEKNKESKGHACRIVHFLVN